MTQMLVDGNFAYPQSFGNLLIAHTLREPHAYYRAACVAQFRLHRAADYFEERLIGPVVIAI